MPRNARVAIAIAVTLLAVGASAAYSIARLLHWDRIGLAGIAYWPEMPKQGAAVLGLKPGGVYMVYPSGAAERAGIRPRQDIVTVNGVPIKDQKTLDVLAERLKANDVITYRLRSNGAERDVRVRLASPFEIPVFVFGLGVTLLVAAAFVGIGLLVFLKKPDDRRVAVFYAMVMVGATYHLAASALALDAANMRGIVGGSTGQNLLSFAVLTAVAIAFLPITLHLALVFPHTRKVLRHSPRALRWVYGLPATTVAAVIFAMTMSRLVQSDPAAARRLELPLNVVSAVLTLAGLLVALRIARRGRTEGMRSAFWTRPLQSLLVGVAVLLGFVRIADALNLRWLGITAVVVLGLAVCLPLMSYPLLACISLFRSYREAGAEERRQVK
ncbi:MAG TPA: PDZ domain-containing protein, partial [Thermoanaerobaculia bacterium]|nr:PDZ domain-containing protein [Thermoanaerobaculia bacterium]